MSARPFAFLHVYFAFRWLAFVGIAKLQLGAELAPVDWWRRSIEANRNFPMAHVILGADWHYSGAWMKVKGAAQAALGFNPSFTVRRFLRSMSTPRILSDASA